MQLFSVTSNDKHRLYTELQQRIRSRVLQETLIIVSNQLMVKKLRATLQRELKGLAPRIVPLESWLDELTELSFSAQNRPKQVLSPGKERPLVLADWIRNHTDKRISRFAGARTVDVISEIIGDLRRAGRSLGDLLKVMDRKDKDSDRADFAYLLQSYEHLLQEKKWLDREELPLRIDQIPASFLREKQFIFYELGYVFESQKTGLARILRQLADLQNRELAVIQYEPYHDLPSQVTITQWVRNLAKKQNWSLQEEKYGYDQLQSLAQKLESVDLLSDEEKTGLLKEQRIFLKSHHNSRSELSETLRRIRWMAAQTEKGKPGSRFSDYAILVGNLSDYQELASSLSKQYEVPVFVTRGAILGSHPIVRRFTTLLSLELHDFQIDDIYQIFADNQFKLLGLKDDNEEVTPNIRSFCQFCREYNLRTLNEADERLSTVSLRKLQQLEDDKIHRDEARLEKERAKIRQNEKYYTKIVRALSKFRLQYDIRKEQPLSQWIAWSRKLVEQQQNLGSNVANQARQDLLNVLDNVLQMHERLGLHPDLKMPDFLDVITLALKDERESNSDQPEAVLLSDATYFSETQNKITFLLGLNEGSFPRPVKSDFLRFRYQREFSLLLRDVSPDAFLEARHHLQRQLDNAGKLYLSRARNINQKKVIGSALWQDIAYILQWDEGKADSWSWGELPRDIVTSDNEWRRYLAENIDVSVAGLHQSETEIAHAQLIAAIEWERSLRDKMGMYDGVLSNTGLPEWDALAQNQIDTWWQKKNGENGGYRTSISRLDEYANSPLEYFFNTVLKLKPLAQYHEDAESNIKGTILHKILQEFYTAQSPYARTSPKLIDPARDDFEKAKARMDEISQNVFEEYSDQLGYPDSPFPAILRGNMIRILHGFLKNEQLQQEFLEEELWKTMRPATFYPQHEYGMEYRWEVPLEIPGIEETVLLNGFIDRIDIDPEGKNAIVYDYKSGSSSIKDFEKEIKKGLSFQLPVYGYALLQKGIDHFVGAYYYLPINSGQSKITWKGFFGDISFYQYDKIKGRTGKYKLKRDFSGLMDMGEIHSFLDELIKNRVSQIITLIRKGVFNLSFERQKEYSDFKMVTRYQKGIQDERLRAESERQKQADVPSRYYLGQDITLEDD